MKSILSPLALACVSASLLVGSAFSNDYDEVVDGDISNNRFNPTCFELEFGVNRLSATQQGSTSGGAIDRDYLTIIIPPGLSLNELTLTAFDHPMELAFMGFQEGDRFVGTPFMTMASDLLGGHIYGQPDLGTDLLISMANLPTVQGFPNPLPAGSYSFWFNQGGGITTASFEFHLIRDTVGNNYCSSVPNSTGDIGSLYGTGSSELADQSFALFGNRLPPSQLAMAIVSSTQGSFPGAGGSLGQLCLGGPIGRLGTSGFQTSAAGTLLIDIDWMALPLPMGTTAAAPGETWNFQLWYRDVGGVSHFSPGLAVLVE